MNRISICHPPLRPPWSLFSELIVSNNLLLPLLVLTHYLTSSLVLPLFLNTDTAIYTSSSTTNAAAAAAYTAPLFTVTTNSFVFHKIWIPGTTYTFRKFWAGDSCCQGSEKWCNLNWRTELGTWECRNHLVSVWSFIARWEYLCWNKIIYFISKSNSLWLVIKLSAVEYT